jgi:hypothetical protein
LGDNEIRIADQRIPRGLQGAKTTQSGRAAKPIFQRKN